jgi:Icc-related predicted phosphoesterase
MPTINLCHSSDQHGRIDHIPEYTKHDIDAYVMTGDFFPDGTKHEQEQWFIRNDIGFKLKLKFSGRKIITVDGNHDFASFAECMVKYAKYDPELIYFLEPGKLVELYGYRWAGFSQVPFIDAHCFNNQAMPSEMAKILDQTFNLDPNIIVTHSPPQGVLSGMFGCSQYASKLFYKEHNVELIMMGHIHESKGFITDNRYQFRASNAACTTRIIPLIIKENER